MDVQEAKVLFLDSIERIGIIEAYGKPGGVIIDFIQVEKPEQTKVKIRYNDSKDRYELRIKAVTLEDGMKLCIADMANDFKVGWLYNPFRGILFGLVIPLAWFLLPFFISIYAASVRETLLLSALAVFLFLIIAIPIAVYPMNLGRKDAAAKREQLSDILETMSFYSEDEIARLSYSLTRRRIWSDVPYLVLPIILTIVLLLFPVVGE